MNAKLAMDFQVVPCTELFVSVRGGPQASGAAGTGSLRVVSAATMRFRPGEEASGVCVGTDARWYLDGSCKRPALNLRFDGAGLWIEAASQEKLEVAGAVQPTVQVQPEDVPCVIRCGTIRLVVDSAPTSEVIDTRGSRVEPANSWSGSADEPPEATIVRAPGFVTASSAHQPSVTAGGTSQVSRTTSASTSDELDDDANEDAAPTELFRRGAQTEPPSEASSWEPKPTSVFPVSRLEGLLDESQQRSAPQHEAPTNVPETRIAPLSAELSPEGMDSSQAGSLDAPDLGTRQLPAPTPRSAGGNELPPETHAGLVRKARAAWSSLSLPLRVALVLLPAASAMLLLSKARPDNASSEASKTSSASALLPERLETSLADGESSSLAGKEVAAPAQAPVPTSAPDSMTPVPTSAPDSMTPEPTSASSSIQKPPVSAPPKPSLSASGASASEAKTIQRQAVDALALGDVNRAHELYARWAELEPGNEVAQAAARLTATRQ